MKENGKNKNIEIDLKEIIIELWCKKWIIAASAIFCALVACLIWGRSNSIPMYESTGSMMILNQKEEAADSTQLSISTRLTDDYASVMLSRNTVNRVISNLDLDVTYEELSEQIVTEVKSDSRVITVTVTEESPLLAKQIVDEILELSLEYIKDNLEVHAIMILDEGNLADEPLPEDNNLLKIAVLFCAGAIIAAFAIIILFVLNDTIRKDKDVEFYLDMPLLAQVSKEKYSAEEYEVLRTNIKVKHNGIKSVVVTKSMANEKIADLAYQLAVSFAKGTEKVLYINADLRNSKDNTKVGLVDVLAGSAELKDALAKVDNSSLYVLDAGKQSDIPSEMLDSNAFNELLNAIKEEYAYIVLNTPAVNQYIDAAIVASKCDGVILAIEHGKTDYVQAQKAVKQLTFVGADVIGSVISKK